MTNASQPGKRELGFAVLLHIYDLRLVICDADLLVWTLDLLLRILVVLVWLAHLLRLLEVVVPIGDGSASRTIHGTVISFCTKSGILRRFRVTSKPLQSTTSSSVWYSSLSAVCPSIMRYLWFHFGGFLAAFAPYRTSATASL